MTGDGQLRALIERILRLKEEQDSLAADIREVYAEAKGSGFDKTAMGQLVSHLRKVEKVGVAAVEEGQSVFDLYLDAYRRATGTPIATHTHEASQSYAEAKGRDAGSSSGRTAEFDSANAGSSPAPVTSGELTDTQEQPETASEIPTGSHDQHHELVEGPEGQLEKEPLANADAVASVSASISNPQPNLLPGAGKAGDVPPPSSPAALSEADMPAFLKPEQRKSIADYRPHCLNPDACGATGLTHCYACRRAMQAASATEAA